MKPTIPRTSINYPQQQSLILSLIFVCAQVGLWVRNEKPHDALLIRRYLIFSSIAIVYLFPLYDEVVSDVFILPDDHDSDDDGDVCVYR